MNRYITIVIADDTEIAREGLHRLLSHTSDIRLVASTGSIADAIRLTRELKPDVVLMDLKWSGDVNAGIAAIQYLRNQSPETKIIAMTVYDHLLAQARAAGADAAISKDFSVLELHDIIRDVYMIEARAPLSAQAISEREQVPPITDREREILLLISQGLTDREIAKTLHASEHTVKNHIRSILTKLGASNRSQAVVNALQKKILVI